ncbi:MAG: methyl-accepting chemotaxis protein [Bacteroidota bacterium]
MLKNLSISKRLIGAFALLVALLVLTNVLAMVRMAAIMDDLNSLVDDRVVKVNEANRIVDSALANGRALRGLLLVDTPAERLKIKAEVAKHRQDNADLLTKLEGQLFTEDAKALIVKIKARRAAIQDLYQRYYDAAERSTAEAKQILFNEFIPANNTFVDSLEEMVELQESHMRESVLADRKSYAEARTTSIVLLLVGIGISVIAAIWIIRSITTPLNSIRDVITQVCNNNDFTKTVNVSSDDEVGETAQAFNKLLDTLRQTLQQLKQSIARVADASNDLVTTSGQSAQASNSSSESASAMAASVEQVSVSINQVSDNARAAADLAHRAGHLSSEGSKIIGDTVTEMEHIANAIDRVAEAISKLGTESDQISGIVQVIKDVADQTNLLALNAAIEAARAGETGRGFAVVADEVRKLAERTTKATGEISLMINSVQSSSHSAVEAMRETLVQVKTGRQLAEKAGNSIVSIRQAADDVVNVVADIADSIAEQSTASQSIAQQLEHVAQATEENNATSSETASSAHQLGQLAVEMRNATERFKI